MLMSSTRQRSFHQASLRQDLEVNAMAREVWREVWEDSAQEVRALMRSSRVDRGTVDEVAADCASVVARVMEDSAVERMVDMRL